ncbi:MAG TPA: hypothetical protein VE990_07005 [Acidimicrobiales bacterium]|nr:hypothetical protein [Acidimicrobiales bacterium]
MGTTELVAGLETLILSGDADGFVRACPDGFQLCVPGRTSISGDHAAEGLGKLVLRIGEAVTAGRYRPELIGRYQADSGVVSVFDNHVVVDGQAVKYHSVHEWLVSEGRPVAMLVYLHEYEVFEAAWR